MGDFTTYPNRVFSWDGSKLQHFFVNYVLIWLNNIMSWTSQQVARARANIGGDVDVSVLFPTSGVDSGNTYTLEGAIAVIPDAWQRGGMTIRFVSTSDNNYIRYNLLSQSFTTDTTQWAIDDTGMYVENPEFIEVKTDSEGRILWAIKADGSIYWGAGVPQQVIDYVTEKISELSLDEYDDIVAFLNGLEEGDKTLQQLLDEKVDKEEGKTLIPAQYIQEAENPEYVEAKTDGNNKLLEGIKTDGTKIFGSDVDFHGKQNINGVEYFVVSNPEWLIVWIDIERKILMGIKTNGSIYCEDINLSYYLLKVKNLIEEKGANNVDWNALNVLQEIENPEFIKVETDSNGRVLSGRRTNGEAFENVGFNTNKATIAGATKSNNDDPEKRVEVKTDAEKKVVSYRDKEGVLHEGAGIETPFVKTNYVNLSEKGLDDVKEKLNAVHYKRPNIPLYGTANIKTETFYLPIGDWSSYADDVVLIQMHDDTDANAVKRLTISSFYIKSTLTPLAGGGYDRTSVNENSVALELHAGKDVVAINDKYFAKTLWTPNWYNDGITDYTKVSATKVTDPVTGDVIGYEYNGQSTEVKQVTDIPPYKAWKVTKQIEHYCIVDFNFGSFYTENNVAIGIKYQGSSTTAYRKRNFRFTFYKNNTFAKKNKVKFGDMLRSSGYNLKANWLDNSRIKEMILYPTLLSIWMQRPESNRFPWSKEFTDFSAATGFIQGFPIRLYIDSQFYGMYVFGLKKDERNYVLDGDDDTSGIFVSSSAVASDCWSNPNLADWEDEMMDEMSQDTTDALTTWFDFINNRLVEDNVSVPFNIKNIPSRMDVQGFVDYFIGLQVFLMWDNTCRNMILHTRSDKKKVYPFFYDLDNSLSPSIPYDDDIFHISAHISDGQGGEYARDMSFWETIVDTFWDEIVSRYRYLRSNVLSIEYITEIYHSYADNIPSEDYTMENAKWGVSTSKNNFDSVFYKLQDRLSWLDINYFKY